MLMASSALVFSISPSKKPTKKVDKDEERALLILAPFNKAPKINFGQVKINQCIERSLLVVNPQEFGVKLNIKNTDLNIDNLEVEIERHGNIDFRIKWQPNKADSYKFSIIFEVSNSRLKFIVHAFGICFEPPKKKVYKNLTILQPIRSVIKPQQSSSVVQTALQLTNKKENNKENQPKGVAQPKSVTTVMKKEPCAETTYIIENSVEHFEKILEHVKEKKFEAAEYENDLKRRQTDIIKTPQLVKHFKFNFNDIESSPHESFDNFHDTIISSASVSNLNAASHFNFQTPRFNQEPLRKKLRRSNSDPELTSNEQFHEEQKNVDLNLSVTPKFSFNSTAIISKTNFEDSLHKKMVLLDDMARKHAAFKIQRTFKNYKKRLNEIKVENERKARVEEMKRERAALKIQQTFRLYKKRLNEIQVENDRKALIEVVKRKRAAVKIQRTYRLYMKRLNEIRIENARKARIDEIKRKLAAVKIQQAYRLYKKRLNEIKIENENNQLVDTLKRKFAGRRILRAYLAYKKRVFEKSIETFIRNRAARVLQKYTKKYLQRQKMIKASNTIRRAWFRYKLRKSLECYRNAAITIQKWTRSMKDRYNFLRFRRVVIYFQKKYKQRYYERNLAVLKIQRFYLAYRYRMFCQEESRIYKAATVIQSLWRGYIVRKEINIVQLHSIRQRLSMYIQNPHLTAHLTLGYRIKRSLDVMEQTSPSIHQILAALLDFQVVTRLSKECCIQFTNAGAVSVLYEFIQRCNRSTPHMDLIKLCLSVFINLSKCDNTCGFVIQFDHKINESNCEITCSNGLNTLLLLLNSYQSSNAQIFMHVCVLLIILCTNERLSGLREAILHPFYLKTLLKLYSTLERRTNFKLKTQRLSVIQSNNQELLNESINSTVSMANSSCSVNSFNQVFSLEPDWILSKKAFIQLADPLAALQYLLINTLKVKVETLLADTTSGYKTPKKNIPTTKASLSSVKKYTQSLENLAENSAANNLDNTAASSGILKPKRGAVKSLNVDSKMIASKQVISSNSDISSIGFATSFTPVESKSKASSINNFEKIAKKHSICSKTGSNDKIMKKN